MHGTESHSPLGTTGQTSAGEDITTAHSNATLEFVFGTKTALCVFRGQDTNKMCETFN